VKGDVKMKTSRPASALFAATVLIAGCAHAPTGPGVMVLPGASKSLEQFQTDDGTCRQMAGQEIEKSKGGEVPAQTRYDMTYMQCMYAKGHQVPVPGGRPGYDASGGQNPPARPAAPPAGISGQADCERSGGVWRTALNLCEFPKAR
jgi:hypothetical protein